MSEYRPRIADQLLAKSLEALFNGTLPDGKANIDIDRLAYLTCRGGWPGALTLSDQASLRIPKAYLMAVLNSDISKVDDIKRDSVTMTRIIRSLARNQGEQLPYTTIRKDIQSNENTTISDDTVEDTYVLMEFTLFLSVVYAHNNPF